MTVDDPIVIVGAGQAGAVVAQSLRAEGYTGRLAIIGSEPHLPYERPPLSKAVLTDVELPALPTVLTEAAAVEKRIELRLGSTVVSIDRGARKVRLEGGEDLSYGRLVLATGGRAAELRGIDSGPRIHCLRSWDDALDLRQALRRSRRVAVIGGGWVGLEAAAAARSLSCEVVLLEHASRLCSRSGPEVLSEFLHRLHSDNGVDILLDARIADLRHLADGVQVRLADGTRIDADLAVLGVGIIANDELASQSGLATDRGIITDPCGRTTDPFVFACGDVALFSHARVGRLLRLESWANAEAQGRACARAVLGLDASYDEVPRFWSDQFGINMQIIGVPRQGAQWLRRDGPIAGRSVLFALDGGVIACAIAIDSGREASICRRLVQSAQPVDPKQLTDASVDLRRLL